mmetsp:Transcript_10088/g.31362  ORF Transcript_10088/g.31362 Transcript_10088/m.31362 type:complete len:260 (+) Transcript_10088:500-1279(+)
MYTSPANPSTPLRNLITCELRKLAQMPSAYSPKYVYKRTKQSMGIQSNMSLNFKHERKATATSLSHPRSSSVVRCASRSHSPLKGSRPVANLSQPSAKSSANSPLHNKTLFGALRKPPTTGTQAQSCKRLSKASDNGRRPVGRMWPRDGSSENQLATLRPALGKTSSTTLTNNSAKHLHNQAFHSEPSIKSSRPATTSKSAWTTKPRPDSHTGRCEKTFLEACILTKLTSQCRKIEPAGLHEGSHTAVGDELTCLATEC